MEGFLGVDICDDPAVDVRQDAIQYLQSLPAHSVQEVFSRHFLEHLDPAAFQEILKQTDRVLVPGGQARFIVPHYSNPYFYSDPTHRQAFGVHTFSYLCDSSCLTRIVPTYARIPGWSLRSVRVGFMPYTRPRILGFKLWMPSDLLNGLVNLRPLFIELFERYFCGVLSIYEIEYRILKGSTQQGA